MKKRIIALTLLILSVLYVWMMPAMADTFSVTFSMEEVSGAPGETVKVPLKLESSLALASVGITGFSYDTNALVFNGFTDYGLAANASTTGTLGFDDEKATIVLMYNPASWIRGGVCNLSFTIRDTAEAGDYDITYYASVRGASAAIEDVGCIKGTVTVTGNEPAPHVHDFGNVWSSDPASHWHTCINQPCEAVQDMASHADNDSDNACDACGYILGITHVHSAGDTWSSDKNSHWKSCTNQPCDVKLQVAEHTAGAWQTEAEPTETTPGKRSKYCVDCERLLETEVIPATGGENSENDTEKLLWWMVLGGGADGGKDFADVTKADWFYDDVNYVSGNGLMEGTSGNRFSPYANTSRAMVVTILWRMMREPVVYGGSTFHDVPSGQWYTDAVIWAAENNIVDGYGNGIFGVNDNVTREQLAVILYRFAQYCGRYVTVSTDLSGYADYGQISIWAREAMEWANFEGLINGRTATVIAPSATANRAELAAILHRFCK